MRTAVRTYLLHLPGSRVPTDVRMHLLHILVLLLMRVCTTALPNAINTHLLHKNCCTYCTYLLLTADDVCYYLLLYVLPTRTASTYRRRTYVREERKAETYQKVNGRGRLF